MKLKNKISGEIKEFALFDGNGLQGGATLESLTKEWEDYEEPKEYWFIDEFGMTQQEIDYYYEENKSAVHDKRLEVGNYFETKEEAEKAVERLRAWKRLKDAGFRFIDWELDDRTVADGKIWFDLGGIRQCADEALQDNEIRDSMKLLFGGEK